MFQHLFAGLAAVAFTRLVDRRTRTRARAHGAFIVCAVVALGMVSPTLHATDTIADGVTVRIRSNSIESGWHRGRIKRDSRRCSMVQLDRPTEHGYTMLALMVVDALQLGNTGQWTAVNARQAIASEPAHCLVEGSD
jgi:hypothetical protein